MTRALVERAMGGDRDAFGALAARSLPRLVGIAGLILGRSDVAEDAAQESLIRAWRDVPSIRDPDRFDAWLYRVLVRACYDHLRVEGRRSRADTAAERRSVVPDSVGLVAERDAVAAGLARLNQEHRAVLVLRYYLDLGYDEIAAVLDVPAGTVKSRLSRALDSMRAALAAIDRAQPTTDRNT